MPQFVEPLESRQFLSTVTLAAVEAKLATDVGTLVANARQDKVEVVDAAKTFASDVKALHLKNGALKTALQNDVAAARSKIQTDVSHIITTGFKDGQAVVSDVMDITLLDAGNATKIAKDQKHLAADIKTLEKVETPIVDRLISDVTGEVNKVGAAVQAIVTANSADQSLQTDWAKLSTAFQTAQTTLTPDLTNVISDLNGLSTAT